MYAIVDIETTGGNNTYHGITEIAVYVHDGQMVIDSWQSLINPGQHISSFITQLTGITNDMVASAPTFADIAHELFDILHDKIFVAHSAAFDYGFIRSHFDMCGFDLKVKKLCTVRLSRKIFPGHRTYSLGKFCAEMGIDIANRHRAAGDAEATAQLFSLLLKADTENIITGSLKKKSGEHIMPPNLDKKIVDALPEKPGVYYFHDKEGTVIYVGKAINIKSRVLGHFFNAEKHGNENDLRHHTFNITYQLTGNELIALLLESEEIKRKFPRFNTAQKSWSRNFCIFKYEDQNGYIHLAIEKYNRKKDVLNVFPNYLSAREFLTEKVLQYRLCPKLCHLQLVKKACYNYTEGTCDGACIGVEDTATYNLKIADALEQTQGEEATYFIIGQGKTTGESSVVYVEKGHYLGFGFFADDYANNDAAMLIDCITWRPDTPDVQRILSAWIQKNGTDGFIYKQKIAL